MSRQPALQREEVFAIIQQLLAEGTFPTHASIRQRTEGRGSPVVFQRYLGEFAQAYGGLFAAKIDAAGEASVPTASGLQLEIDRIAKQAIGRIEREQSDLLNAIDARQAALDQREHDVAHRERQLGEREIGQIAYINSLKETADQASASREELLVELATSREQLSAAVARSEALLLDIQILHAVDRDINLLKVEIQTLSNQLAAAEQGSHTLEEERDRLRVQAEVLGSEVSSCRTQIDRLDQELSACRIDLQCAQARLQDSFAASEAHHARVHQLHADHASSLDTALSLSRDMQSKVNALLDERLQLEHRNSELLAERSRLAALLASAKCECDALKFNLVGETKRFDEIIQRLDAMNTPMNSK